MFNLKLLGRVGDTVKYVALEKYGVSSDLDGVAHPPKRRASMSISIERNNFKICKQTFV